jgi:hypothetical protein
MKMNGIGGPGRGANKTDLCRILAQSGDSLVQRRKLRGSYRSVFTGRMKVSGRSFAPRLFRHGAAIPFM